MGRLLSLIRNEMKPNWEDAPDWANYLAMDSDRTWFWHEEKPNLSYFEDEWLVSNGMSALADSTEIYCQNSLEERPCK